MFTYRKITIAIRVENNKTDDDNKLMNIVKQSIVKLASGIILT